MYSFKKHLLEADLSFLNENNEEEKIIVVKEQASLFNKRVKQSINFASEYQNLSYFNRMFWDYRGGEIEYTKHKKIMSQYWL